MGVEPESRGCRLVGAGKDVACDEEQYPDQGQRRPDMVPHEVPRKGLAPERAVRKF